MSDKDNTNPQDTLERFRLQLEDLRRAMRDIEAVLSSPEMAAADTSEARRSMALAVLETVIGLVNDCVYEIDDTKREIAEWLKGESDR
jgi:hypothetical protein